MKLNEIIDREYAIIETEYGCISSDVTYDTDDYQIALQETVKAGILPEAVIDCIKENADYSQDEDVDVWTGKVFGAAVEDVTVYIPESWA